MSILDAIFGKTKETFAKPIKDCRNCTYFRPQERLYGYCSKFNTKLVVNQAPLCPDYMAYGEVTVSALDAGVLTSGLLNLARIPRLDLTKLPLGSSGYFLKGQGASDSIYALLTSGDIPSLDASKIASGVLAEARIPHAWASDVTFQNVDIDTDKYTTLKGTTGNVKLQGTLNRLIIWNQALTGKGAIDAGDLDLGDYVKAQRFVSNRPDTKSIILNWNPDVGAGQALLLGARDSAVYVFQIDTSGKIAVGSADASLITSGILDVARIPNLSADKITSGDFPIVLRGLGYKNTSPSISSPSRSLGTTYQNTTGKTLVCFIYVIITGNATAGTNHILGKIGSSSPPTTQVADFSNSTIDQQATIVLIVPDQWYYLASVVGTVTLSAWREMPL